MKFRVVQTPKHPPLVTALVTR